jgi:hypothetical protein
MKSKLVKESLNEMFTTQDGKSHRLKKGMVVRIMDEDDMIKKFRGGMHEDYLQYNLQIAGEVVEIKRAFSSHSKFGRGGGVDSFYVEGYEPYNLNSGFDDLIIAEVIEDPIRENLKEEMTPADRGMEAARREDYVDNDYVLLKIRAPYGQKPEIKALAVGSKQEMEDMKYEIMNKKRNYSPAYYLAVHRVG